MCKCGDRGNAYAKCYANAYAGSRVVGMSNYPRCGNTDNDLGKGCQIHAGADHKMHEWHGNGIKLLWENKDELVDAGR